MRTIVRQEGLFGKPHILMVNVLTTSSLGLWKGFGATSLGYLPTQAIFYGTVSPLHCQLTHPWAFTAAFVGTYEFNKDRLSKALHYLNSKYLPGQEADSDRIRTVCKSGSLPHSLISFPILRCCGSICFWRVCRVDGGLLVGSHGWYVSFFFFIFIFHASQISILTHSPSYCAALTNPRSVHAAPSL